MSIVLDCIRRKSPVTRRDIARLTGMSRSTVTNIVTRLMENELVKTISPAPSSGGRRPVTLALNPHRYSAIGLKLQPDGIVGCLTDLNGTIVHRTHQGLRDKNLHNVLQTADDALHHLTSRWKEGAKEDTVIGVGIAVPGLVDSVRGISVKPHFFRWKNVPFKQILETRWGLPVTVENDARAGCYGEKWARGDDDATFLFVTVGIGIGAGIVINGHMVEGDLVGAGHLGHVTVDPTHRQRCHCGLYGCLETVANDAALMSYWKQGDPNFLETEPMAPADIFQAAVDGDRTAEKALDTVASYLGVAIGHVIKILGVKHIVIGGETGVLGHTYFAGLIETHVKNNVFPETRDDVQVTPSQLGYDAWQIGTASLALESFFRPPLYDSHPSVVNKVTST